MASDDSIGAESGGSPRRKGMPLGRSARRLSFERELRLWLYLLGLPMIVLCWLVLRQHLVEATLQTITLLGFALTWIFVISVLMERIVRPLQTLANVVAA